MPRPRPTRRRSFMSVRFLRVLVLLAASGSVGVAQAQISPLGPQFQVNTYTSNSQSVPAVAADSAGNFVVTWRSPGQDGSSYGVFGQRYDSAGTPQGGEFQVNTYA